MVRKRSFREEKATPYLRAVAIEVMAERGPETLRFGPMKPIGLTNPHTGGKDAVVQLRQDNTLELSTTWSVSRQN